MKVLLAPDKFKGSLTAAEVVHHLGGGLTRARHPVHGLPLADGGDGSVAAAIAAGFRRVRSPSPRPPANATRATHRASTAPPPSSRSPTPAACTPCPAGSSRRSQPPAAGLGQAVVAHCELRPSRIVLALGGSASTDGGAGMLAALGASVPRRRTGKPVDRRRRQPATGSAPSTSPACPTSPGSRSSSPATCRTR